MCCGTILNDLFVSFVISRYIAITRKGNRNYGTNRVRRNVKCYALSDASGLTENQYGQMHLLPYPECTPFYKQNNSAQGWTVLVVYKFCVSEKKNGSLPGAVEY